MEPRGSRAELIAQFIAFCLLTAKQSGGQHKQLKMQVFFY